MSEEKEGRPQVDARFIVERGGKAFVLFAGLLNLAHQQGLKAVETQLLQVAEELNHNQWIVRASVTMPSGVFTGLADADPSNVASAMRSAALRLCETRAVARALRLATNVGMATFEESDGDEPEERPHFGGRSDEHAAQPQQQQRSQQAQQTQQARPVQQQPAPQSGYNAMNGGATQAQIRAVYSIGHDQHKLTDQEIDQRSVDLFGASPAQLSKKQASDFITSLKAK